VNPTSSTGRLSPSAEPTRTPWSAIIDGCTAVAFCASIALPSLMQGLGAGDRFEEDRERRPANTRPQAPEDLPGLVPYARSYESWYEDQFPLRSRLVRLHSSIKLLGFHAQPATRIAPGREGWLFLAGSKFVDYYRNSRPFTHEELDTWAAVLQDRVDFCQERGIEYLFVIAPNKATIYPEFLPERFQPIAPRSRLDQLIEHLGASSTLEILDLRPALAAAKEEGELLYYPHGSHWNGRGALVAYREIMERLRVRMGERVRPHRPEHFRVFSGEGLGDSWAPRLHLDGLLSQTEVLVENLRRPHQVPIPILEFEGNHMARETRSDWLPDAVIFRDSFAEDLIPLLSCQFRRAAFYWDRHMLREVVEHESPDVVIHEMVERDLSIWTPSLELDRSPPTRPAPGSLAVPEVSEER